MALPAVGSVTINQSTGAHSGSGMTLDLFERRRAAMEATIFSQKAFVDGDANAIPLLVWLAEDCEAEAQTIREWLTVDADVRVDSPTDGTLIGEIQ